MHERPHGDRAVRSYVGLFGDPFDVRDATAADHPGAPPGGRAGRHGAHAVHEEVDRIADDGVGADELAPRAGPHRGAAAARGRLRARPHAGLRRRRAHPRPRRAGRRARRPAGRVTPEAVQDAARGLARHRRRPRAARRRRTADDAPPCDLSARPAAGRAPPAAGARGRRTTLANGLRVARRPARRGPAGRAAAAGARSRRAGADRRRARRPHAPCCPARCCWDRRARPDADRRSCCRPRAPSCRSRPTPTASCSATTLLPTGLPPAARRAGRAAHRRDLPRRRGRRRAGPGGRADRHRPLPAGGRRPHGAGRPPVRRAPLRRPAARRRAVAAVNGGRAAQRCTASASLPAGSTLVLVGDLSPGRGRRRRRGRPGRLDGERRAPSRRRRCSAPAGGPGAAGRPARRGAVQRPPRWPGARPHATPTCRRPAGQHGLRRLLLLPLGGEHPRGRATPTARAARRRPPAGRLARPSSTPTSPPT